MRVNIESTNTGPVESGIREYNTTDSQYYDENSSAKSNSTYPQNEEDADYEEYNATHVQTVLITAPYQLHESCFCRYTAKDWLFEKEFGGEGFFCKIACDADKGCKGFLSVGNGCALATTSLCPDGCTKYFEGNRGNIIKDIPFSRLVGGKYFRGDRLGGCFSKIG